MIKVCILLVLITYGNGGADPLISNLSMRCSQQSTARPSHFNPYIYIYIKDRTQRIGEWVYPRASLDALQKT